MQRYRYVAVALVAAGAVVAGCGGDDPSDIADSSEVENPAPANNVDGDGVADADVADADAADVDGATNDSAAGEGVTFSFTDNDGYTFDVEVTNISVETSIEDAPPGRTDLIVTSAFGRVTNTTPGRTAPANNLFIDVAVPRSGGECSEHVLLRCLDAFVIAKRATTLWNPDSYGANAATVPPEGTYELRNLTDFNSTEVDESVTVDGGYWFRVTHQGVEDWVAAGGIEGAPPPDDV